jgi:hypothetical protein
MNRWMPARKIDAMMNVPETATGPRLQPRARLSLTNGVH